MEKFFNYILFSIVLICFYIILTVNLDWFWTIGISDKADNINSILVNLSYSFFAAYFFYLLTMLIPNYFRKKDYLNIIDSNILWLQIYGNILIALTLDLDLHKAQYNELILSEEEIQQLLEQYQKRLNENEIIISSDLTKEFDRAILNLNSHIRNLLNIREQLTAKQLYLILRMEASTMIKIKSYEGYIKTLQKGSNSIDLIQSFIYQFYKPMSKLSKTIKNPENKIDF